MYDFLRSFLKIPLSFSVLRSRVSFFDETPVGKIMNIFSKVQDIKIHLRLRLRTQSIPAAVHAQDMGLVDERLPAAAMDVALVCGNMVKMVALV